MPLETLGKDAIIAFTADIVAAHVSNNSVSINSIGELITSVHVALSKLGVPIKPEAPKQVPAVSIRASVKPDYIICLEDGKKVKMLKRHLTITYNMTPDDYRTKWGLSADYPMTAPNYAQHRKELAVKIGLGRKKKVDSTVFVEPIARVPVPRLKKSK
ncbi:Transcriptional regulatory protein ros [Sphingobium sp. AntQ-1]|uniref:MucR family transcriptional regulator n=1 Tax=Sphingobium sp. AntQ-1 TaxID=2930091 RepID=UPI00234F4F1E|nr:MucR family transcriptional regulator [Sphingobium sp. AntQ-1]WCP13565.1 Transcriptional regulatory protein ros [Sphingobium sp. AntQ-1]